MPTQDQHTDRELLRQIAEGNEKAFKSLFDAYFNRLFYYIARFIKSDQVAEELAMDIFMKVWSAKTLAARIENFDAFLFRVARNKSIDFLRSASRDFRLKELLLEEICIASDEKADTPVSIKEYEEKLRDAISLLPPQRKKVYNLSSEQDLTHDQIARQLSISKATVNNHIVEARRFVRNYLIKGLDLTILILLAIKQ